MPAKDENYDVIICGGGPTGLLVAYGLQRFGISVCVIERKDKANIPMYGRASSYYQRSIELMDSYDLLEELVQSGFIARGAVTYKQGKRVTSRGWHSILTEANGTFANFILNLRLKNSEAIFQAAFEKLGGTIAVGWRVTGLDIDTAESSPSRVRAYAREVSTGNMKTFIAKHIVGADGAKSIVRTIANINMQVTGSTYQWVRIDGLIETDMPDAGVGLAAIESPSHGNVLYVRLERGRTRIGYALNPNLIKKYGMNLTQEQAAYEAQKAMLPFTCIWKEIDWYTTYSVQQSFCENFVFHNRAVFVAGDAAHLHSSAAAQGMNTGIHDAVNLAWKLAGVVKGYYKPEVLDTYNTERQPAAQRLINLDKQFSSLLSGTLPPNAINPATGKTIVDPNELFQLVFDQSIQFNIGLGISYPENLINKECRAGMIVTGKRPADKLLYSPGSVVPVRLQHLTKNHGKFNILVFVGEPLLSQPHIQSFRKYLDEDEASILKLYPAENFRFLTIIMGNKIEGEVDLGCRRFGNIWYDQDSGCHYGYGLSAERGGVIVLRPDGICSFATTLREGRDLEEYFGSFLLKNDAARSRPQPQEASTSRRLYDSKL